MNLQQCYDTCSRARYGTFVERNPPGPFASATRQASSNTPSKETSKKIILPLVFHVLTKFDQMKDGKPLPMWVTTDDVNVISSEANRIWQEANIEFYVKNVNIYKEEPSEEQSNALAVLEQSDRQEEEEDYELNQTRLAAIRTLSIDQGISDRSALNAFFVPYMGSTRQGNAVGGVTTICCGVWTDKPSRGRRPPQRMKLAEPEGFELGSIGRTVAHELGHCLDLRHLRPPPGIPTLMGEGEFGYSLLDSQVRIARARAQEILRNFALA